MKTHALVPALTLAAALLVPPLTAGAQGHRSDRGGRPPAHGYYGRQPSRHQGHGYSGRGYGSHGYRYARPYYGSRRYYAPPPPYYGYGYGYGATAMAATVPSAMGTTRRRPRRGTSGRGWASASGSASRSGRRGARSSRACGGW